MNPIDIMADYFNVEKVSIEKCVRDTRIKLKNVTNDEIYECIMERISYQEKIPFDVYQAYIMNRLSISDLVVQCHLNKNFKEKCYSLDFWRNYILNSDQFATNSPQERLHLILVELAKTGDWSLFEFIWSGPIVFKDNLNTVSSNTGLPPRGGGTRKVTLIKERRTLYDAFHESHLTGKEGTAWKIFNLDKAWMYDANKELYPGDFYDKLGTHKRVSKKPKSKKPKSKKPKSNIKIEAKIKETIDLSLHLERAAKNNDIELTMKLMNELKERYSPDDDMYGDIRGEYIINTIESMISQGNTVEFVSEIIRYANDIDIDVDTDQLFIYFAGDGKYELIMDLINEGIIDRDFVESDWDSLLRSKRSDSFQIIKKELPGVTTDHLTNDIIQGQMLGNREMLIEYATRYPDDHFTLLRSFDTLPADEFIELYKKTAGCISEKDEDDLAFGVDYITALRRGGHDYLADRFEKEIPRCE